MDTVRSMLHHANLADSFWPLAVQAATYVRNRCPTTAVQRMTPHQAWYGHRPDLHSLRVFGCVGHLHIPEQSGDRVNKLSARSVSCINVGYSLRSKAYLLYDPRTHRVHTSKDVTFEETRFIGADSPLARRHIGEGEISVLFPDVAAAISNSCISTSRYSRSTTNYLQSRLKRSTMSWLKLVSQTIRTTNSKNLRVITKTTTYLMLVPTVYFHNRRWMWTTATMHSIACR